MRSSSSLLATCVVVALIATPVVVLAFLFFSGTLFDPWSVVVAAPLASVGLIVLLRLVQIRRPYRSTRRTLLTRLDRLIDKSFFGVGSLAGWTSTNPAAALTQLQEPAAGWAASEQGLAVVDHRPVVESHPFATTTRGWGDVDSVPYTVVRGDSFWSLAERFLGAGPRWQELANLNVGRQVAPGHVLGKDEVLAPGWVIQVPEAVS